MAGFSDQCYDHVSDPGEFGGDGENRTLIGWVQASHPPVERCPHGCGGGNRTHLMAAYETAVRASSSSPHQKRPLNYFDMERVTGFEPVSGPWQGPILAARRYPRGASGQRTSCALIGSRRTLRASLEGFEPGQYVTLARNTKCRPIQLSKNTLRRRRVDG